MSSKNDERNLRTQNLRAQLENEANAKKRAQQEDQRVVPHSKEVVVESDDDDAIKNMVAAYQKQFKTDDGYQEGYADPIRDDKKFRFTFPTQEKAANFFSTQAQENRSFILMNEENQVLAYSDGKGTMFHANGDEFRKGDAFRPSDKNPTPDAIQEIIKQSSSSSMNL